MKKKTFFNISGQRDCLDLFALNVPTDFVLELSSLAKVLRTLLTGRSNSIGVLVFAYPIMQRLAGNETRTRDLLLGKETFYH